MKWLFFLFLFLSLYLSLFSCFWFRAVQGFHVFVHLLFLLLSSLSSPSFLSPAGTRRRQQAWLEKDGDPGGHGLRVANDVVCVHVNPGRTSTFFLFKVRSHTSSGT